MTSISAYRLGRGRLHACTCCRADIINSLSGGAGQLRPKLSDIDDHPVRFQVSLNPLQQGLVAHACSRSPAQEP